MMVVSQRLLVVLNEDPAGSHIDVRSALHTMVVEGRLAAYEVLPFRARLSAGSAVQEVADEIVGICERFKPTQVLFSHTVGLKLTQGFSERVRRAAPGVALGYWEGDWYHWLSKPMPAETLQLASECDVTFACGQGYVTDRIAKAGCREIEYVPLVADERFAEHDEARPSIEFDLVIVGNCHVGRNPIRTMRGATERKALVSYFEKRLGSKFAVFGAGWTGPSAQGPIPYAEQGDTYRRAAVVLGNNDLHAAFYFSNRLPVALMAGVPLVHNHEADIERIVGTERPVRWFGSPDEAWRQVRALLDAPASASELENGRIFARETLSTRCALTYMSRVLSRVRDVQAGTDCAPEIPNPWGVDFSGLVAL